MCVCMLVLGRDDLMACKKRDMKRKHHTWCHLLHTILKTITFIRRLSIVVSFKSMLVLWLWIWTWADNKQFIKLSEHRIVMLRKQYWKTGFLSKCTGKRKNAAYTITTHNLAQNEWAVVPACRWNISFILLWFHGSILQFFSLHIHALDWWYFICWWIQTQIQKHSSCLLIYGHTTWECTALAWML